MHITELNVLGTNRYRFLQPDVDGLHGYFVFYADVVDSTNVKEELQVH